MSGDRLAWYGVGLLILCSQELGGSNPSPRASFNIVLIKMYDRKKMGRRKSQKIVKTGPKNVTTGMCPLCKQLVEYSLLELLVKKEQTVLRAIKNSIYNQPWQETIPF